MLLKYDSAEWKDIYLCEMCELINSERIPFNWIVHTVEPPMCECCEKEVPRE